MEVSANPRYYNAITGTAGAENGLQFVYVIGILRERQVTHDG